MQNTLKRVRVLVAQDEDVAGFQNLKHLVSLPLSKPKDVRETKQVAEKFAQSFMRPDHFDEDGLIDVVEGPLFSGNIEENNGGSIVFSGFTWEEMLHLQGHRCEKAYAALPQSSKDLIEKQLADGERVQMEEIPDWTSCSMHFWRW